MGSVMVFIDEIFLEVMCLLFPISIYIIVTAYFRNQKCNRQDVLLEITLYSSIYLLIKYGCETNLIYPLILLNIPLLVAYLKGKSRIALTISLILIIYFAKHTHIDIIYLIIEYAIYFITYRYLYSKKATSISVLTTFVVIKSFIMSLEMFLIFSPESNYVINFMLIFSIMTIFTFIGYLILYFINKGEEIIDLNDVVSKLEKEKKLRESLFKITHEIKNPIAVCKGYLDMIDYKDTDKVERYIPIIKDEISRTLILMDDFLDYTKIQVEKDITDLYLLLEDTYKIVKPLFKKNQIKLTLNIDDDDDVYMNLDYNRLKQVLVNLLKNSIEAKDNRKKDNYVSIDTIRKNGEIIIRIKDNGIGMNTKSLEKVDEMFYTTKEKGTGLGVALSKEIISQHGGDIKYSSVKGKYTIVDIILPYQEKSYD